MPGPSRSWDFWADLWWKATNICGVFFPVVHDEAFPLRLHLDLTSLPEADDDRLLRLLAGAGKVAADRARFGPIAPAAPALPAAFAHARIAPAFRAHGRTVPRRVVELVARAHEVVDGEVVLLVEEPRAAPHDLLELHHRVDGAHQHDVPHVPRVNARRELLRRGEDNRELLFVVLELA